MSSFHGHGNKGFPIHCRVMRTKSDRVAGVAAFRVAASLRRYPKHLERWLTKWIDWFVTPLGQRAVMVVADAQHLFGVTASSPLQTQPGFIETLAQSRPLFHDVGNHLFKMWSLETAFQVDFSAQLHEYP